MAIVICASDSGLGVVFGVLSAQAVAWAFGWPTDVRAATMLLAFVFAAATGVFFGWYPARRAAAIDPIHALHYE